jgi:CRISPR-associated endonuclease/helicase Cas3
MQRHISKAGLESTEYETSLPFDTLRQFQRDTIEWFRNGEGNICAVTAPTGAGKSAIFAEIAQADSSHRTLLVYPTNALIRQQIEKIEANTTGLNVAELSGDSLEGHGKERLEELRGYASPRYDVVVTNPDILQALFSHQYYGDTGDAIEFFKQFTTVVYDEFHFYSPLAASGLFTQMTTIDELTADTNILLTSATPDENFLEHVSDYIGLDVTTISAETYELADGHNPDNIEPFRQSTRIRTHPEDLSDSFTTAAQILTQKVDATDSNTPQAAIIFNSAYESNRFKSYIEQYDDRMEAYHAKDNGYDTNSDSELQDEFTILNTTSKGEVGLDYDLDLLLMQNPYTSRKFLQRAGRVGRKSPARIEVFGIGSVGWPQTMSYAEFEENVYRSLRTPLDAHKRLYRLRALRTAVAVADREYDNYYRSPDIYQVTSIPEYQRWKDFATAVFEFNRSDPDYGPLDPEPNNAATMLLEAAYSSFDGLRSLRGVSVEHDIEYPAGRETDVTTYDLATALKHYGIKGFDDEESLIKLHGAPAGLHITYGQIGTSFDGHLNNDDFERELTNKMRSLCENADFSGTDVKHRDMVQYVDVIPVSTVLPPTEMATEQHTIEVEAI